MAVVYASTSLELALLEAIVHLDPDLFPQDLIMLEFEVEEAQLAPLARALPRNWNRPPPYDPATQAIGDEWVRNRRSLGLRVPASVLPQRENVLLNPAHPAMAAVRIVSREPLVWPPRLVGHLERLKSARGKTRRGRRRQE